MSEHDSKLAEEGERGMPESQSFGSNSRDIWGRVPSKLKFMLTYSAFCKDRKLSVNEESLQLYKNYQADLITNV